MDVRPIIRTELDARKWTQKDLAIQSGVSPSTLTRYLSGEQSDLTVTQLVSIARAFGQQAGDWLGRSSVDPRVLPFASLIDDMDGLAGAERGEAIAMFRNELQLMMKWRTPQSNVIEFPTDRTVPRWTEEFPVNPESFVEKDFDYPLEVHALAFGDSEYAAGETGIVSEPDMVSYTLHERDVRDDTHRVIKVKGDSMIPEFEDGWKLLVDTRKQTPQSGEVVAVYLMDATNEGGIIGYWEPTRDGVQIEKANPQYKPVKLGDPTTWKLVGTVQKVIDKPVKRRGRK